MKKRRIALEGATVLSGPDWRPQPDSTVLINGDMIAAVSNEKDIPYPEGTRVMDCGGKYLLPGFIDMHTHCHTVAAEDFLATFGPRIEGRAHVDWFLRLFLAYGVTTVRDVGNFPEVLDLKRESLDNAASSPAMYVAGELLEGPDALWPLSRKVPDPDTARSEVRRQKELGVDWVKLYLGLDEKTSKAAIKEAHAVGLRAAGHIWKTTARQAAKAGIDSLEHTLTLADEGFLTDEARASLPPIQDGKYRRDRFRQVWTNADLDSKAGHDLIRTFSKSNVAVCPTLIVHENTIIGPDKSFQNFAYDYVPQQWLDIWEGRLKMFNPAGEKMPDSGPAFSKALDLVSRLASGGVRILGGTDAALWNPFVVPGASIHREMELLIAARMEPKDVLSSVSWLAAETLGLGGELGTIEEGRIADLVLLNGNPLDNVRNTRDIAVVVNKGHTFTPEDILESSELVD